MADTFTVGCPKCKRTSKAPTSLKGKKIRCKGCGQIFPALEARGESEEWGVINAYEVVVDKDKLRCPFCASDLAEGQILCLKCGYNLETRERMQPKVLEPLTFGDYFFWWLPAILGFLLICGLTGLIIWMWLANPTQTWSDLPVREQVVVTVFASLVIGRALLWIFKKRVLDPHPPEVEKVVKEKIG